MSSRPFRHTGVLPRFRDALRGLVLAYREEPNLRFHTFAAACAGVAGYAVGLRGWEVAYLGVTIALVLTAELLNTAVERAVDLAAAGRLHPLAAAAKQVASGAVLLTAFHALFAAVVLFVLERPLGESLRAVVALVVQRPPWLLPPVITALLGLFGGARHES
ncbi:MAG: diacylglycerol kinase family protein [Symbiobacterium sp.]|uniref:diacylglycerol kinase family protein n=1 Tax=Symbiobacterium sp. TaxID=1971213 RepID=UPI003464E25F